MQGCVVVVQFANKHSGINIVDTAQVAAYVVEGLFIHSTSYESLLL